MNRLSNLLRKLLKKGEDTNDEPTFCCTYGSIEEPQCWEHKTHLAQAEIDCAYRAVKDGYANSEDHLGSCQQSCPLPLSSPETTSTGEQ
jgi:hypothetical protein